MHVTTINTPSYTTKYNIIAYILFYTNSKFNFPVLISVLIKKLTLVKPKLHALLIFHNFRQRINFNTLESFTLKYVIINFNLNCQIKLCKQLILIFKYYCSMLFRKWCMYSLCKLSNEVAVAPAKLIRTVTPLVLSHTQQQHTYDCVRGFKLGYTKSV